MGRPRLLSDDERRARKKALSDAYYARNKEKILGRYAARYGADPEKFAARHKAWSQANPEKAKACRDGWIAANRERDAARRQAYRRKNRDKARVRAARFRQRHPDRVRECQSASRKRNAEKVRRTCASRRAKHREKINATARKWRAANPGKQKQYRTNKKAAHPHAGTLQENKRRAIKLKAAIGDLEIIAAWVASWKSKRNATCYWCRGVFRSAECHSDHIVALMKGGAHSIENLCISCSECNGRKNARTLAVWNQLLAEPILL